MKGYSTNKGWNKGWDDAAHCLTGGYQGERYSLAIQICDLKKFQKPSKAQLPHLCNGVIIAIHPCGVGPLWR